MGRVLIVTGRRMDRRRCNYHLHETFFKKAFGLLGHQVVHYGPVAHGEPDGPLPYDARRPLREVVDTLRVELILQMWTSGVAISRARVPVPKLTYICDLWHKCEQIDICGSELLIVRARLFEQWVKQGRIMPGARRCLWLPFSFDEQIMDSAPEPRGREPLVGFAGGARLALWPMRRQAISRLFAAGLLGTVVSGSHGCKGLQSMLPCLSVADYYATLKKSLLGLACSTRWRVTPAKHVEIPAAGCVLLTDGAPGMDWLFPRELYRIYRPDNVVEVVRALVSDPGRREEAREIGRLAAAHALAHHSDTERAVQLGAYLSAEGLLRPPTEGPAVGG